MNNDVKHSQLSESEIADIINRLPPESPRVQVNRTGYVAMKNGKVSENVARAPRRASYEVVISGRTIYQGLSLEDADKALERLAHMFVNVSMKRTEGSHAKE